MSHRIHFSNLFLVKFVHYFAALFIPISFNTNETRLNYIKRLKQTTPRCFISHLFLSNITNLAFFICLSGIKIESQIDLGIRTNFISCEYKIVAASVSVSFTSIQFCFILPLTEKSSLFCLFNLHTIGNSLIIPINK